MFIYLRKVKCWVCSSLILMCLTFSQGFALEAPSCLITPDNAISNEPYKISWCRVPGAVQYKVYGEQSGWLGTVYGFEMTRSGKPAGSYNYKVEACDANNVCSAFTPTSDAVVVSDYVPGTLNPTPPNENALIAWGDTWFNENEQLNFSNIPENTYIQVAIGRYVAGSINYIALEHAFHSNERRFSSFAETAKVPLSKAGAPNSFRAEIASLLSDALNNNDADATFKIKARLCLTASNSYCSAWVLQRPDYEFRFVDLNESYIEPVSPLHSAVVKSQKDGSGFLFDRNSADLDHFLNINSAEYIKPYLIGRDIGGVKQDKINGESIFDGFYFWIQDFLPDLPRPAMASSFMYDAKGFSDATQGCFPLGASGCSYDEIDAIQARQSTQLLQAIPASSGSKALVRKYLDEIFGVKRSASKFSEFYFADELSFAEAIDTVMTQEGLQNTIAIQLSLPSYYDFREDNPGLNIYDTSSDQFNRIKAYIDEVFEQYTLYRNANSTTKVRLKGFDITRESFCRPNIVIGSNLDCSDYNANFYIYYENVIGYIHSRYPGLTVSGHPVNAFSMEPNGRNGNEPEKVFPRMTGYSKEMVDLLDHVNIQFGAQQRRTFNRRLALTNPDVVQANHQEPVDREMLQWMIEHVYKNSSIESYLQSTPKKLGYYMEASEIFFDADRALAPNQPDASLHRYGNYSYYADYLLKVFAEDPLNRLASSYVYDDAAGFFACMVSISEGEDHCNDSAIKRTLVNIDRANAELDILIHFIKQTKLKRDNPAAQVEQLDSDWIIQSRSTEKWMNPAVLVQNDYVSLDIVPARTGEVNLSVLAKVSAVDSSDDPVDWTILYPSERKASCGSSLLQMKVHHSTGATVIQMTKQQNNSYLNEPTGLVGYNGACINSSTCDGLAQTPVYDRDQWRLYSTQLRGKSGIYKVEIRNLISPGWCNTSGNDPAENLTTELQLYRPLLSID